MSTAPTKLMVHSLTEAQMYIWVTPCNQCGSGPLVPGVGTFVEASDETALITPASCRSCGATCDLRFDLHQTEKVDTEGVHLVPLDQCTAPPELPINPTENPSRVIDVAGWLTLEALLGEQARQTSARAENVAGRAGVRLWQLLAGACAEEALKFYEEDNELPPADAFFQASSRQQFRERPAMFIRERLIQLRTQRPTQTISEQKNRETTDKRG